MRPSREPVVTTRAVRVECIPDGRPADLPAGTQAQITQALGGAFTLWVEGQLMRLRGADADAIAKPIPAPPTSSADVEPGDLTGLVWETLKTCYDPEIPVDIVELGLVYACDDPQRNRDRNLLCGAGVHVCPGAPLARLELRLLMKALLAGTSDISLVSSPPPELAAFPASGFSSLQVRLQ